MLDWRSLLQKKDINLTFSFSLFMLLLFLLLLLLFFLCGFSFLLLSFLVSFFLSFPLCCFLSISLCFVLSFSFSSSLYLLLQFLTYFSRKLIDLNTCRSRSGSGRVFPCCACDARGLLDHCSGRKI
jgi:hypothetical protein